MSGCGRGFAQGLALSDLEGRTDKLAVACWANEVRVVRASSTYAALIRVDVTRRNALAAPVAPVLPGLVPDDLDAATVAPTSPGMPPVGLRLSPVAPGDTSAHPRQVRGRKSSPRTAATAADPVDNPRLFGSDNADWA